MKKFVFSDEGPLMVDMGAAEIAALKPDPTTLASEARSKRNALLTASDWTQVADAPVDQSAWATYRQALRDVPDQAGFPDNIDWPTAPE